MTLKSFAEYYHEETKYSPQGLSRNQKQIDWNNQPQPFKEYKNGKKIELAKYILRKDNDDGSIEYKNLEKIASLLYLTNGVTAIIPYTSPLHLRAAPSAGGLYPTEIYVIAKNYKGLEDGVYNFQAKSHSLIKFWNEDITAKLKVACFDDSSFDKSTLSIVLTGVFFRSEWRYQERAYRRILLDTGHVIGNMIMYSSFINKYCHLIGGFKDSEVSDLLWLDKDREVPLAIINISDEKLDMESSSLASDIQFYNHNFNNLIADFHKSGNILDKNKAKVQKEDENIQSKLSLAFGETLSYSIIDWENSLRDTIVERRSIRAFTGESITKDQLSKILSFSYLHYLYKDQNFDAKPEFFDLSIIETYIAVTDVDGLEDGCYHYDYSKNKLKQIRFKNFREEICYLCLGQELGRDAGAVIFHTTNLRKSVEKYGERAYRYLHLDSGNLGQRLNLASLKVGLGVSGIAGFFDDQVNELLGIPESEAVLYITTIGQPFKD